MITAAKDRGSSDTLSAAYAGSKTAYEESRIEEMDIVFMLFDNEEVYK